MTSKQRIAVLVLAVAVVAAIVVVVTCFWNRVPVASSFDRRRTEDDARGPPSASTPEPARVDERPAEKEFRPQPEAASADAAGVSIQKPAASTEGGRFSRLVGTVLDAERRPVVEARVRAETAVEGSAAPRTTTTDGLGRFELQDLTSNEPLRCTVARDDPPIPVDRREFILASGQTKEIEWQLPACTSLHGRVTDSAGRRVTEASVALTHTVSDVRASTTVDETGHYEFPAAAGGDWVLRVTPASEELADAEVRVHLDPTVGPTRKDVKLEVGAPLSVRLVDVEGRPVKGISVVVNQTMPGTRGIGGISDANGIAVFRHLELGEWSIVIESFVARLDLASQRLRHHHEHPEQIDVVLAAAGAVQGRIVDATTGAPAVCQQVTARPRASSTAERRLSLTTSAEPGMESFEIDGLDAGLWDLVATADDGRIGILEGCRIDGGETCKDATIRIAPGAMLRIRRAGEEGVPLDARQVSVVVRWGEITVATGHWSGAQDLDMVVPAGSLRISFDRAGVATSERDVVVKAGEVLDVEVPR